MERHARRAIAKRRGNGADGVLSVVSDVANPGHVFLQVNSGGNAIAAENELRLRGYCVEPTNYDPFGPGNYGVRLRVGPTQPADFR